MVSLNFVRVRADPCLFTRFGKSDLIANIVAVYVNDLIISCKREEDTISIKNSLKGRFCMKEMGEIKEVIGWEIERKKDSFIIHQMKYIGQLKEKYCDNSISKPSTPIQPGMLHHRSGDDEERIDKTWNRLVIGSLLYIATSTRADICFAVSLLSRHMEDLCRRHGAALKRLLDYVVYTAETNMRFPFSKKETIDLKCWVDADLGGPQLNNVSVNEMVDCRSQTGIHVAVNNMAVVFKSKRQPKTAKSSTHSELIASCAGVSEMGIICELVPAMVQEKGIAGKTLLIDKGNALRSISTGYTRQATRHVKLDLKSSREIMNEAGINMMFVGTKEH
jgi:Reverse transcriptase (RNA-dependent DNA polymerase)